MNRKIIIDCDPGIDDAIALCIALFDHRLDVLAITAVAGTVEADMATQNVNAIVAHLDPPRYPRIGSASTADNAPVMDDLELHGLGGLGNFEFEVSDRQRQNASDKVIGELIHRYPNEITLVCLGPLTNLSRLSRRDPAAIGLLDKIIISGGSVAAPGNASAVAEHNIFFDPQSAEDVFALPATKSLVPLDVTEAVGFGVEILEQLPSRTTRAGSLLHKMLPYAFRAYHQKLGRELIPLHDPVTMMAVLQPDLFTWQPMAGCVETSGLRTRGMTVFDQRLRPEWQPNMEVALDVDLADAEALVVRSLRYAGQQT